LTDYVNDISCASSSLCVAAYAFLCQQRGCSGYGDAVISTDPAGGTWEVRSGAELNGLPPLWGVSCPSSSLCVATGGDEVATSTDPAAGSDSSWALAHVNGVDSLRSISCPSVSLCVAVGGDDMATSTDPVGGSWEISHLPGALGQVSCASGSLCAVLDAGRILTSTEPTVASSWMATRVPGARGLNDLSCSSEDLCVAVGENGRAVIATPGPPDTAITGAKVKPGKHKARFRFTAERAVATGFRCKLTRRGSHRGQASRKTHYKRCDSPMTYKTLPAGRFVFRVRTHNSVGLDPTPARKSFRI
jgi:hypothetical protein